MSTEPTAPKPEKPASPEMLVDLNFVPTWAKGTSGKNPYEDATGQDERRGRRDDRRGGRGGDRRDGRGGGRGAPRGGGDRGGQGRGGPGRGGPGRGGRDGDRRGGRDGRNQRGGGDRRDRRGGREDSRPRREPLLPIDVRFLPDRAMLGAIVREMHQTFKAYPLMDLASLFISKPDHCLIKLQAPKPREGKQPINFYQCRHCRAVFLTEAACEQHALSSHLDDFYDVETIEGEAPKGAFTCVGRCRRTGTLLGPPNHHAYGKKLQEMVSTRFPGMSVQAYREQVEMVRDPELIEQWKNESKQQKQYRVKIEKPAEEEKAAEPPAEEAAPEPVEEEAPQEAPAEEATTPTDETPEAAAEEEAPAADAEAEAVEAEPEPAEPEPAAEEPVGESMDLDETKRHFRETFLPGMVSHSNRVTLPATVAQSLEAGPIKNTIRERWMKESRFPLSISLAMRPAFRHMRLHMFKTNRKNVFVTAVKPKPLDPGAAIESIRNELNYLHEHPGCHRSELVEALRPGAAPESPEIAEVVGNLRWLVEKGHVIEFYDGRLALPSDKMPMEKDRPRKGRGKGPKGKPPRKGKPDASKPAPEPEAKEKEATPEEQAPPSGDAPPTAVAEEPPAPEAPEQAPEAEAKEAVAEEPVPPSGDAKPKPVAEEPPAPEKPEQAPEAES